jgi:hypothetical protein
MIDSLSELIHPINSSTHRFKKTSPQSSVTYGEVFLDLAESVWDKAGGQQELCSEEGESMDDDDLSLFHDLDSGMIPWNYDDRGEKDEVSVMELSMHRERVWKGKHECESGITSIYDQFKSCSNLTEIVEQCSTYAAAEFDHEKAEERRRKDIREHLVKGDITQALRKNMVDLQASGNVLNSEEIKRRVDFNDPGKALLLNISRGFDLQVDPSVRAVQQPTEDCSNLEYHHARSLIEAKRAVLVREEDFMKQVQEINADCHPCIFHVVPKMGKGTLNMGRSITDYSATSGNSVNGPRVGGKLFTSSAIAAITNEIFNPSHPQICLMMMKADKKFGAFALIEVSDINNAYFLVPLAVAAMLRCSIYVRIQGEMFVMIMAVAAMGFFASGFLWESVKNSIVYEARRAAKESGYGIDYESVHMFVDDKIEVAHRDYIESHKTQEAAFLGTSEMGILGRDSVSEEKYKKGRSIDYTGNRYNLDTMRTAFSYGRMARIIHTLMNLVGKVETNDVLSYNLFVRLTSYTHTISSAVPFLAHYHRILIDHLKGKNTSKGTKHLRVRLSDKGAATVNIFTDFLISETLSPHEERWNVPMAFVYAAHKPKGIVIGTEQYLAFVRNQEQYCDYYVTVDASGGLKALGIHFEEVKSDENRISGAFARVLTENWWNEEEGEIDIHVLELLAGVYGILLAITHLQHSVTRGKIVHLKTDNTVALAGHLRGSAKKLSKKSVELLKRIYLLRSMLLESTQLLFVFAYVPTLENIVADALSRRDAFSDEVKGILRGCTEYILPSLYP